MSNGKHLSVTTCNLCQQRTLEHGEQSCKGICTHLQDTSTHLQDTSTHLQDTSTHVSLYIHLQVVHYISVYVSSGFEMCKVIC